MSNIIRMELKIKAIPVSACSYLGKISKVMRLSHDFDSEVSAVIGTEGIAEHLEIELNQVNAALYSKTLVIITKTNHS